MNVLLASVGRRTYLVEYFKKAVSWEGKGRLANSSALSPAFAAAVCSGNAAYLQPGIHSVFETVLSGTGDWNAGFVV